MVGTLVYTVAMRIYHLKSGVCSLCISICGFHQVRMDASMLYRYIWCVAMRIYHLKVRVFESMSEILFRHVVKYVNKVDLSPF